MINWRAMLLLSTLGLSACGAPQYPADWPKPAFGLFSRKGGCPDLTGSYDNVRSELNWLLGPNPDFEVARKAWFEHSARITQADDGSWLNIAIDLNERGLPDYREHMLKYNLDNPGSMRGKSVALREGDDYTCANGWLYGAHFPQATRVHGWQRKLLRMRKDRNGGLIAGATISQSQSLGWGDSRSIPLGAWDGTRWYRWPARPTEADAALQAAQSVELRRYGWANGGSRVPARLTNFQLEPICLRVIDHGVAYPLRGDELRRSRFDKTAPPPECPDGWGKLDSGGTVRREFHDGDRYLIEWVRLSDGVTQPNVIAVGNARQLPLMPKQD